MEVQYNTGYICKAFEKLEWDDIRLLQRCKEKCRRLVVGLPTDSLFRDIYGEEPEKSFLELSEILLLLKAVDEVVPVIREELGVQKSYERVGYDCLFYGSEYGKQFEADKAFLTERGVGMISLVPDKINYNVKDNCLQKVLENAYVENKIVLFGTGKYFEHYMKKYGVTYPPAYAVDNSSRKWMTKKQEVLIQNPAVLLEENPDDVLVVLCCKEHEEIKKQILEMGAFDYRVLRCEPDFSKLEEYAVEQKKGKRFQKGYLCEDFQEIDELHIRMLHECKKRCEKLIVGIPSVQFEWRMTGKWPEQGYEEKRNKLLQLQVADDVIAVDIENITVRDSWKQNQYDVRFYGTEYGRQYQSDKRFLDEKGVKSISMMPKKMCDVGGSDALLWSLQNASCDRKIVIFGTGKYFEEYMKKYGSQFPPAYAIDNIEKKWNTQKLGIMIRSPHVLESEKPEKIFVVLCIRNYKEALEQLLEMGNFDYRPFLYNGNLSVMEEWAVIRQEENDYMKKSHAILMKLMREFDRVCRKYNLHYYVIAGSLIGVVRHQGLIPWDDDVDVAMYRSDYEILREKANEIWPEGSDFLFLDYDQLGNNSFYDFMTRIVYMKEEIPTRLFKKVEGKARKDIQNKLVMDIYVMENADKNETKHKIVTNMMKGVYALAIGHRAKIDYSEYAFLPKPVFWMVRMAICLGRCIPIKCIFFLYEKLRGYARNKECDCVFESNNGAINYMPWRYEKKLFGKGKRLPMCDLDAMVPEDCDGLLKAKGYGDYMSFPPVIARKPSHSSKAKGIIW